MRGASIRTNGDRFIVEGGLVPSSNEVYNLGAPDAKWNDLYLSGSVIHMGNVNLEATNEGELVIRSLDNGPVNIVKATSALTVTATSNVVTDRLSPYTGSVIDIGGSTLCNLILKNAVHSKVVTSKVEPFSNNFIDFSGTTLSNLKIKTKSIEAENSDGTIDMRGSTLSNVHICSSETTKPNPYFHAGRGGDDFTVLAGSTIDAWTNNLTLQMPDGAFNTTTGIFQAPITGTYMFTFGFNRSGDGELRLRINGTDIYNFLSTSYGTVIHRLTVGTTVQLVIMEADCAFHPNFKNDRLWFQGTLLSINSQHHSI